MGDFDVFHEYGYEIERRMRLQTYPMAVKMLKKESDIPEGAQRPMKDFGYHLATCQGFVMSRREGLTIAMTKEDMYCPESVIGYGLAEPPQYFLDGYHHYPQVNETLEASSAWAHDFPRLEVGKYIGVVSAPLMEVNFVPDVVIIYCNSAQLARLLGAATAKDGRELTCTVGKSGACVFSVVPPLQYNRCQVSVPCSGDRRFAGAQDNEMIFSLPLGKMEEVLLALRYAEGWGYRLPLRCVVKPEADMPDNYRKLGQMMGMDWMQGDELAKYR